MLLALILGMKNLVQGSVKPNERRYFGKLKEGEARTYLCAQGLEFFRANVFYPCGEIDLVMGDPQSGALVFVEVRYRSSLLGGELSALYSLSPGKKRRLRNAISVFLSRHRGWVLERGFREIRVDGFFLGTGISPTWVRAIEI